MEEDLVGRSIKLHCTLNDRNGNLIALPGSVLIVGDDVEESVARQLLRGSSADLIN